MSNASLVKRSKVKWGFNPASLKDKSFWFQSAYLLLAVTIIVELLGLALLRLNYPDNLDWVEGATVDQIKRILAGNYLYGPPDLNYIALMYPPLYLYIAAALSWVMGEGFLAPRLISFFSVVGILVLAGRIATKESGEIKYGILAAGICASGAATADFFGDMARVDWLFTFFILLSIYLLKCSKSTASAALAAVIFCLAALTKQTALLLLPFLALGLSYESKKRSIVFFVLASTLCGMSFLTLNYFTHGWLFYYIFEVPSSHYIDIERNAFFLENELLGILAIPLVFSVYAITSWWQEGKNFNAQFYSRILILVIFMCWFPRVKIGGHVNNLFPLCVMIAVLTPLGFKQLYGLKQTRLLAMIMLLAMLVSKVYNPLPQILSPVSVNLVSEKIKSFKQLPPGQIFAPSNMYLPSVAGRNDTAFWGAIVDVMMSQQNHGTNELYHSLEAKIAQREFSVIVLPEKLYLKDYFPFASLTRYYTYAGKLSDQLFENLYVYVALPSTATHDSAGFNL